MHYRYTRVTAYVRHPRLWQWRRRLRPRRHQQHSWNSQKEVKTWARSHFFVSYFTAMNENESESKAIEGRRRKKKRQNYNKMNRMRKFEIKNGTEFFIFRFSRHFPSIFLRFAFILFLQFSVWHSTASLQFFIYEFRSVFCFVSSFRAHVFCCIFRSKFSALHHHSLQLWRNGIMGKAFSWTLPTITQSQ